MMNTPPIPASDFANVHSKVLESTGRTVVAIDLVGRNEFRRIYNVILNDGSCLTAAVLAPNLRPSIIESEVATLRYIRDRTPVPVPRVLAFDTDISKPPGPYILTEKPTGISLETLFQKLSADEQDSLVAQIAKWTIQIFRHRFNAIGSLYADSEDGYILGPIIRAPFFVDGRAKLPLNRGPYQTTRNYMLACVDRELDCTRTLFAQEASEDYQRKLQDNRLQVEHSMGILTDIIHKCRGLDDDEPALAAFSIDLHDMPLKNIYVSQREPTKILCVAGWDFVSTKPLWHCGRLPHWLMSSLSDTVDSPITRLSGVFRRTIIDEDGPDSAFIRALDSEDTRAALMDLCDYNAFKDGFLLRPALESISATMPGEEDVEGLSALLDPTTVTGRVARISLLTQGSAGEAMTLAFTESEASRSRRGSSEDPRLTTRKLTLIDYPVTNDPRS